MELTSGANHHDNQHQQPHHNGIYCYLSMLVEYLVDNYNLIVLQKIIIFNIFLHSSFKNIYIIIDNRILILLSIKSIKKRPINNYLI